MTEALLIDARVFAQSKPLIRKRALPGAFAKETPSVSLPCFQSPTARCDMLADIKGFQAIKE
jgi:hypothetical protein